MTHAPARPEPGVLLDDRAHELVGVQAALHQHLGAALPHELHRPSRARVTVRGVLDLVLVDVEVEVLRDAADPVGGTDEDGPEDASVRGLDHGAQRGLVARVRDSRRDGRNLLAAGEDPLVLAGAV